MEEPGLLALVKRVTFREVSGSASDSDVVFMKNYKLGTGHAGRGSVKTLVSTCGGLFGVTESGSQPLRRDLITGTDVAIDPYTWFRCSTDRKAIAARITS